MENDSMSKFMFMYFFYSVLRPFQAFSLISRRINQVFFPPGAPVFGGAKTGAPGGKTPDTPASRTWLVPHVTRAPSEARTHSGVYVN